MSLPLESARMLRGYWTPPISLAAIDRLLSSRSLVRMLSATWRVLLDGDGAHDVALGVVFDGAFGAALGQLYGHVDFRRLHGVADVDHRRGLFARLGHADVGHRRRLLRRMHVHHGGRERFGAGDVDDGVAKVDGWRGLGAERLDLGAQRGNRAGGSGVVVGLCIGVGLVLRRGVGRAGAALFLEEQQVEHAQLLELGKVGLDFGEDVVGVVAALAQLLAQAGQADADLGDVGVGVLLRVDVGPLGRREVDRVVAAGELAAEVAGVDERAVDGLEQLWHEDEPLHLLDVALEVLLPDAGAAEVDAGHVAGAGLVGHAHAGQDDVQLEFDEIDVALGWRGRYDGDVAAGGQAHHAAAGQVSEVAFGHGGGGAGDVARGVAHQGGVSAVEHGQARLEVLAGDLGVFVELQVAHAGDDRGGAREASARARAVRRVEVDDGLGVDPAALRAQAAQLADVAGVAVP